MSDKDKKLEVIFMPGCFDNFEGDQDELNELISIIQNMTAEDIEANSRQLTVEDFDELPANVQEQILSTPTKRKLQ